MDCKPGSVLLRAFALAVRIIPLGDTLPCRSSTLTRIPSAAEALPLDGSSSSVSLFELAPGRACLAAGHPAVARGLLPHDFTLTCTGLAQALTTPSSPCGLGGDTAIGGVISVALSLGSPRVAVSDFPTLRSPDFPPADDQCPPAILRPPPTRGNVTNAASSAFCGPGLALGNPFVPHGFPDEYPLNTH